MSHALVFSDKIVDIIPESEAKAYSFEETIDAGGRYISPGFIDIHTHGCAGADAMDIDESALDIMRSSMVKSGVTAFLPTTMTMPFEIVASALMKIKNAMKKNLGAQVLGCHLEGPFISADFKGAQDKKFIIKPDIQVIGDFLDTIKMITLAPEMPDSLTFIQRLSGLGIVVAIGHSSASYEQAIEAIHCGASHVTHTFNAMVGMNHRKPGIIGALVDSEATCDLISDNIHLHPATQRMLLKLKGADKIILITDSMRASLMADGQYDLGGQSVHVKDGQARLADGTIAGSVLTMNNALRNFQRVSNMPIPKLVELATANPARKLNIYKQKGSIQIGKDADLVIFDENFNISNTVVLGEVVYREGKHENSNC